VHGFTLDPGVGEFLLSHPKLQYPAKPKYYSANQGYEKYWREDVRQYMKWLQGMQAGPDQPELSSRYTGSFVADFHRNLLEGGVYCYPPDIRQAEQPQGKLRLLVEAIPLSFIAQQAGGLGSEGMQNILDIQPVELHQRTPLFIGQRALVEKAEAYIREYIAR
jgi:fructose-1,6-bisphosphatase I